MNLTSEVIFILNDVEETGAGWRDVSNFCYYGVGSSETHITCQSSHLGAVSVVWSSSVVLYSFCDTFFFFSFLAR